MEVVKKPLQAGQAVRSANLSCCIIFTGYRDLEDSPINSQSGKKEPALRPGALLTGPSRKLFSLSSWPKAKSFLSFESS